MERNILSIIALLVAGCLSVLQAEADTASVPWPKPSQVVRLWPGDAPGLVTPAKPEEIVNERIRNVSVPELWVYLPDKSDPKGTALLICPGGGYSHLAMGLHVGNVVKFLDMKNTIQSLICDGLTLGSFLPMAVHAAESTETKEQKDLRMAWCREARFGMFIHWGPYSILGGHYKGHPQKKGGAEWIMNRCKIPWAEYQQIAESIYRHHP